MALGDGITEVEKAYTAGIIDGEGYIGIKCSTREHVQRERSHRVYVAVSNTDQKMIKFLHDRFGGSVEYKEFPKKNCRPQWRWRTSARNAVQFLTLIQPYLITKKLHANVAMGFQTTVSSMNKGSGLDEETLMMRDVCMNRIHQLNKRGL